MAKSDLVYENQPLTVEAIVNNEEKRIGLFGGTFNPPHLAHLIIAEQVKDQLDLQSIQFLPTAKPSHKTEDESVSVEDRIEMVDLAIQDNSAFALNLTDVNRGGLTYTIDTIQELIEANPDTKYYFIIGGDSVNNLDQWKEIEKLVDLVQFVGVERPNYLVKTNYPIIWIDVPLIDISSSQIRQKVNDGSSIHYLVPEAVNQYIEEKGLYQNDEL